MIILTPSEAVKAAEAVYKIRDNVKVEAAFKEVSGASILLDQFALSDASRFTGRSGGLIFGSRTGFGVIAKGKGIHQNEAIVMLRGTDLRHIPDLLTDLNMGLQVSTTGKIVHAGFNQCYNSFASEVLGFLRQHNPSVVHCVGHSLGGALATLVADAVSQYQAAQTYLYTFGSPRVGFDAFSQRLTAQVGAQQIFRVNHKTDVVPCIPLWPFSHVPQPGTECYIESPGAMPGFTYHAIGSYGESVNNESWEALRRAAPYVNPGQQIEAWLKSSASPVVFSVHTVFMIQAALQYLLQKILHVAGIAFQASLGGGLTIMDQLAMILAKGVQASKEIAAYVLSLMQRIASVVGCGFKAGTEMTLGFIRWVLSLLAQAVYNVARTAVRMAHSGL